MTQKENRRTAIVTGGSRGIGRAACEVLAAAGNNIVINFAGNRRAAEETAAACEKYGVEILLAQGDVSCPEDCDVLVSRTMEQFGRIDILVNNAGITRDNLLMRMSEEEFDQVIDTNLKGSFLMMKALSRQMMKQRYGRNVKKVKQKSGAADECRTVFLRIDTADFFRRKGCFYKQSAENELYV